MSKSIEMNHGKKTNKEGCHCKFLFHYDVHESRSKLQELQRREKGSTHCKVEHLGEVQCGFVSGLVPKNYAAVPSNECKEGDAHCYIPNCLLQDGQYCSQTGEAFQDYT